MSRMPVSYSRAIIQTNPACARAVRMAAADRDLQQGSEEERVCLQCAAELHARSWFEDPRYAYGDSEFVAKSDNYIRMQTEEAFEHCVDSGIVPRGIFGVLFWYAIRQAAWQFLHAMFKHWWQNQAEAEAQSRAESDAEE